MKNRKQILLNFLIGVAIGIPLALYATKDWYKPPLKVESSTVVFQNVSEEDTKKAPMDEVKEEIQKEVEEEAQYDSLDILAVCVEAEAGNQGLLGKRLVVDVILNRVDDEGFPDSIEEVITQPTHFKSYWNGAMDRAEPMEETYEAIRLELEKRSYPELFYFNAGDYSEYGTPWKKIGEHYFSTK